MALNFLDYALSVGAGIAEKDMADMKEERNANFNLALEEFKDNKALITKLAENRYARDVNRYDKEFEKFENLKQVYSQVANNELSAKAAAYKIASFEDPQWKNYTDDEREDLARDYMNSFEYNYKKYAEGDMIPEGSKVGDFVLDKNNEKIPVSYTIKHDKLKLVEPKITDYFLDSSYFTDKAPKLEDFKGKSILTDQMRNLLKKEDSDGNKEGVDLTNYLADLDNKKGTEISKIIGTQEYTSTNVTGGGLGLSLNDRFLSDDGTWEGLSSEVKGLWKEYVTSIPNGAKRTDISNVMQTLPLNDIEKMIITYQNGNPVTRPDGQNLFDSSQKLYQNVAAQLWKDIFLATSQSPLKGNQLAFTNANVKQIYETEWNNRIVAVDDNAMKGYYVIPLNVMGSGMKLSDFKFADGQAVKESDIRALISNLNIKDQSLSQAREIIDASVYKFLSDKIPTELKEQITDGEGGNNNNNNNDAPKGTSDFSNLESTLNNMKIIVNNEEFKKSGDTIESIVKEINENNNTTYDAKAIELLLPLDKNIPPKKIRNGKKDNPEFATWLQSEQATLWKTAMDYINSLEPEKFVKGTEKQKQQGKAPINPEWNKWNQNYNSFVQIYSKTL